MKTYGFHSADDARALLAKLGAPERLLKHTVLVSEASELLLDGLATLAVPVDAHFVRLGVVFHDAGKIEHASEMAGGGSLHEPAGKDLLIAAGVEAVLAQCCLSHARWAEMESSLEELLVALADTLWKGKRNPLLEERVIGGAATRVGKTTWDLFVPLDTMFERIAEGGPGRLERSR